MKTERWKTIPGHPHHQVSNHGRVRRLQEFDRPFYYKLGVLPCGNLKVQFAKDGLPYSYRVSRLVGQAFSRTFKPSLRAVFRDGNPANCRPSNLLWVSIAQVTGHPYSKNPKALRAGGVI
jgi:hypothetical protein